MKALVKRLGLDSYLRKPYNSLVKKPYWGIRQLLGIPISKQVGTVEAYFFPDHRILSYHEFQSEREYIKEILENTTSEDIFYDVGANIGIYSCFVSNLGADVFSFEPSPTPFDYLSKNSNLNNNFEHYQKVISNTDGTTEFSVDHSDHFGRMSSLKSSSEDVRYESNTIASRRLDTLIEEEIVPPPDVLKIDVEGAEYKVLEGLVQSPTLPKIIYCEVHHHRLEDFSHSGSDVFGLLEQMGYENEIIHKRSQSEFVKATTCSSE